MIRKSIVLALVVVPAALWCGLALRAQAHHAGGADHKPDPKADGKKEETGFLPAYFKMWKALGKDELKGVPEARKELVSALDVSAKAPPKGLAEKDRTHGRVRQHRAPAGEGLGEAGRARRRGEARRSSRLKAGLR